MTGIVRANCPAEEQPIGFFLPRGLLWSVGVGLAGYWLGSRIRNVDSYQLPIIALIVVVSLIPVALEVLRPRRARRSV